MAIELGVAGIYKTFSELLPGDKDLWYELAMEEENHASILVIGSKYNEIGELPDYMVPDSLPAMKETIKLVKETEKRALSEPPTLRAALDMSLKLEKTKEESYLPEILAKETDSEVVSRLKRLLTDTKQHIRKIMDYKKRKGYE